MKTKVLSLLSISASIIIMAMLLSASCQPMVYIEYNATYRPVNNLDTVTFEGWSCGNLVRQNTEVFYVVQSDGHNNHDEMIPIFVYDGVRSVETDVAFYYLAVEYDSVRFTRSSDGASTITYRHDDNESEAQRYFFTREAWDCSPEGEELKDRTYTFKLTDEMFR